MGAAASRKCGLEANRGKGVSKKCDLEATRGKGVSTHKLRDGEPSSSVS